MPLFEPDADLTAIQKILMNDSEILNLLNLANATPLEKAKHIIKRSRWDDLVNSDKRLCVYSIPSRPTRIESLFEEMVEIDCHVPALEDYKARKIIGRTVDLINNTRISGRYIRTKGFLGELPTMSGYYSCGNRFGYYNPI